MDFETWKQLFGKSQDDSAVKSALAAVGVKKIPKLDEDDTDVRLELKGYGIELIMTDEAFLKELTDQDIGEGPLILSGVLAKLGKSHGRDLYVGKLPYGVLADMSQEVVRKLIGSPSSKDDEFLVDVWQREGIQIVIGYSRDRLSISTFALMLPGAE